jgi:alkyl hydroperoxide reductase subunit AhpC
MFPTKATFQSDLKWVFWSENPIGRMLHQILHALIQLGFLDHNAEEQRVRWKAGT